MDEQKIKQLENILCLKGKTVYLQNELKGVLFEIDDFRELLTTFEELQRSVHNHEF